MHTRWSVALAGQVAVLILVNAMVDTVISSPLLVLEQMLDHFDTDQAAWLNASAMLAGAMWAPLLGKSADIYGKRKMLVITLLITCAGGLLCLLAPNIWVFVLGRMVQGAAMGAVFLTVALIHDMCAPRIGMVITGIVTSGNAILSIVFPILFEVLAEEFGFRIVFIASVVFAAVAAVLVRVFVAESSIKTPGRIDIAGALLLGGGLAAVLSYVSLGSEFGWLAAGPLALLIGGAAALARWVLVSSRVPQPVIDIRNLGRPLVLTLLVVVLGNGAYLSMLQLFGLIAEVSPDQRLGYGIGVPAGLLFSGVSVGAVLGGTLAGALNTRIGPAATLAVGAVLGAVGIAGLFVGASQLPLAAACGFLLGLTAGTLTTSGFNMAVTLAPAERHGVVSSLVMVVIAIGSVTFNFVGAAVLKSTNRVVGGETVNSATGVYGYIGIGTAACVIAVVLAVILVRTQRTARMTPSPASS
ncbi:MFS transporter [Thermocatellispora tengchongensis]